jgi:poly-gamma-glutamate synthesis protein (capsule biosynthesis protein)
MFVEAGADAVVGAHPHVMQGMEVYKGVPILYSLGNFVFDQYFSPETRQGLLIELVFSSTSTDVYPIPVTIKHYHPYYATTTAETRIANFLDRSTGIERYIATSTDLIMLRIPAQQ